MKTYVWHVKRDLVGKSGYSLASEWNIGRAELVFPEHYELVAMVEADGDLEAAFELTNHIHGDWTQNPGVTMHRPGPQRSTSVGDVMQNGARYFIVMPMGYKEIQAQVPVVRS